MIGPTDTSDAGSDVYEFRRILGTALATLPVRDRVSWADTVLVVDHALERYLLLLSASGSDVVAGPERDAVDLMVERLKVPVFGYLAAHSRAERARQLDELARRAAAHRQVVEQIAAVVDNSREPASVVAEWESLCARKTLLAAADEVEAKLKKLDVALSTVRTGEEARASAFKAELAHYADSVDDTMQAGRNSIDALLQRAEHETDDARGKIERLHGEVARLLSGAVVNGISAGYEAAELRERRSAVRWRVLAVAIAFLGVVQFAVGGYTGGWKLSWDALISHAALTVTFGAIAGFAARHAAQHFTQQRALRSDHLRIVASMIWMDQMTPEAREELQRELAGPFFRAAEHSTDDQSAEALSMLQLDKFIALATNAVKPKPPADDAATN